MKSVYLVEYFNDVVGSHRPEGVFSRIELARRHVRKLLPAARPHPAIFGLYLAAGGQCMRINEFRVDALADLDEVTP